jgi:hypothetical protein
MKVSATYPLEVRTEIDSPHVSDFVRLKNSDSFLRSHVCPLRVKEEGAGTSSDQALLRMSTKTRKNKPFLPSSP